MRSLDIGVGYGWSGKVSSDARWKELRDFCKGAASQGRNAALAALTMAVNSEDEEADVADAKGIALPNVCVTRLRASVGRFTWDSIKEHIDDCDILVFDLTPTKPGADGTERLSPNVWIEIGYALAKVNKRVFLVHAEENGYKQLPTDLSGMIIGHLPRAGIKSTDASLRSSLVGAVSKLLRLRSETSAASSDAPA